MTKAEQLRIEAERNAAIANQEKLEAEREAAEQVLARAKADREHAQMLFARQEKRKNRNSHVSNCCKPNNCVYKK